MGRRKKKQPALSVSSDQGVGAPKPAAPRYIVDEFGYIGTTEALNWQPGDRQLEQQRAQHPTDATSGMKSENLTNIPESKPAGFLDLSKLPTPKGPFAAVSQKEQSSKWQRRNRKIPKRTQSDPMVKCPYCAVKIRQSRLESHQERVHAAELVDQTKIPTSRTKLIADLLHSLGIPSESLHPVSDKASKTSEAHTISTTDEKATSTLVTCPICHASVKVERLERHIRKVHQQPDNAPSLPKSNKPVGGRSLIYCHVCNEAIPSNKLKQHLTNFHRQIDVPKHPSSKQKQARKGLEGQGRHLYPDSKDQDAFDQAFQERRFGDKYVGLSRREGNGRFGSLPLYDDYGDDADAG